MFLGQIEVQLHARGSQFSDLVQRLLQIRIDLGPETRRLLDGRILRKNEELRAGRRTLCDPVRNFVLPRIERGGLPDGILRTGDGEGRAGQGQSAFIQNCMRCVGSALWSMSFQS